MSTRNTIGIHANGDRSTGTIEIDASAVSWPAEKSTMSKRHDAAQIHVAACDYAGAAKLIDEAQADPGVRVISLFFEESEVPGFLLALLRVQKHLSLILPAVSTSRSIEIGVGK